MNLCSNCQTTIIEASPYREATIKEEPLEPKRSFFSRIDVSPRSKKIGLISVAGLFAGISAYMFSHVALMILLGLLGILGGIVGLFLTWVILCLVPHKLGFWIGCKANLRGFDPSRGSWDNDMIVPWGVGVGFFVLLPGAVVVICCLVYYIGKWVAPIFHIGV